VIRLPLCIQDTKMLKEIVSEDNPLLFPPREVLEADAIQLARVSCVRLLFW